MKKNHVISITLFLAILLSSAYARRIFWRPTDKPPILLQDAITIALSDLKKNDPQEDYFCIGAVLTKTFSEGDWELSFSSKEGSTIWVNVASDKSLRKSAHGFTY